MTAADSNTEAMSSLSSHGISPENQEHRYGLKSFGALIGGVAFIMVDYSGIDGLCYQILAGFQLCFFVYFSVGLIYLIIKSFK